MSWSRNFERCCLCGTNQRPHEALGLCKRCYNQTKQRTTWNQRRKEKRRQGRLKYEELKAGKQCLSCNESHPACLDFHHKDGTVKSDRISKMLGRYSWKRILKEIEKCDVLCSNCHRKFHYPKK